MSEVILPKIEEMARNEIYLCLNKVPLSDQREAFFDFVIQRDDLERRRRKLCIFRVDHFCALLLLLMHLMHLDAGIDEVAGKNMHVMAIRKFGQRSFLLDILQKLIEHCLLLLSLNVIVSLALTVLLLLLSLI